MPDPAPIVAAPVPIGSLPVATSSNPDDRIVIDGVTAGTRTILAPNLVSGGAGAPANFYSDWTFQAATTTPPGNGNVRWDNVISTSVTRLYIANLTNTSLDVTTILGGLNVGMRIYQQDKNTSAQFVEWEITAAPVPQTGYLEVPVALLAAGTTPNTGQVSILYFLAPSGGGGGGGGATPASGVTVSPTVLGATNVQDALEALDAEVTTASSVTVSPAVLGAANVQAALVALDAEIVTAGVVTVSPAVAGG